jgi:hypothetical protein
LAWGGVALAAQTQTNDNQQKALEVLRKTIDNIEAGQPAQGNQKVRPAHEPSFAQAEQLYLQGKMSAKDFQKYLDQHKLESGKSSSAEAQARALEVLRKELNKTEPSQSTAPMVVPKPEAAPPPAEAATPEQPGPPPASLSEVERKMDELLRLKAAREEQARTNAASNTLTNSATPAAPKTKRERLNDLLRLVVDGKITDAEYKEQRSKILSEKD